MASAFAFILYDFTNPQIAEVLNKESYWLSLDSTSEKYLTVFSFHYKPKMRYRRIKHINTQGDYETKYLTNISSFNNPSHESNDIIKKYFGEEVQVKYPAILFFKIQDGQVIDYTMIELEENLIEQSFLELQGYITVAVEALKKISIENKDNSEEIFHLVNLRVGDMRDRRTIGKVLKKITSVAELGSAIMGLKP
ncbi:hypothetical protein [Hymenobacter nivis]|nr:hypothetical protein [Hymenobacter nivis]